MILYLDAEKKMWYYIRKGKKAYRGISLNHSSVFADLVNTWGGFYCNF